MTTIQIQKDGQDPQVINVPEGAKIIIEDGVTVVEPEFKDGDIVAWGNHRYSWVGVYRSSKGDNYFSHHVRLCNGKILYSNYVSFILGQRHATESEKQLLIDAIAKDGKQWNPETKQIEELVYIPKDGDCVELTKMTTTIKKVTLWQK